MSGAPQAAAGHGWLDGIETVTRLVNRVFAALACLIVLAIMALIVIEVVYRYLLNDPIAWVLDVTIYMLVFVFFLALAPALESGSHIEVDLFDPLIPASARKAQQVVGKSLTLLFAAIFFWFVFTYYREIVDTDEMSFTILPIRLALVYWIGPVGVLQFLITAIVLLVRFCQEPFSPDSAPAAGE
jgi:TRAP-type C4-dicarboxylate transport system permease small subunit